MSDVTIPRPAFWLGYLGLLPFVTGAALMWFSSESVGEWAQQALLLYAATILSFIGAVHWGLAMHSAHPGRHRQLALSVVPALVAWVAVLSPTWLALPIFIVSFSVMSALDRRAVLAGLAPAWYPGLRLPLTIIAVFSLGFAWLRLVLN